MSHVTCHISHVMCKFFFYFFSYYLLKTFFWQSGEVSWWRVCYQRGLHHLVSKIMTCILPLGYIFVSSITFSHFGGGKKHRAMFVVAYSPCSSFVWAAKTDRKKTQKKCGPVSKTQRVTLIRQDTLARWWWVIHCTCLLPAISSRK